MPGDIFISYRREDSQAYAGCLFDGLEQAFGVDRVFIDVYVIEPDLDFSVVLGEHLRSCSFLGRMDLRQTPPYDAGLAAMDLDHPAGARDRPRPHAGRGQRRARRTRGTVLGLSEFAIDGCSRLDRDVRIPVSDFARWQLLIHGRTRDAASCMGRNRGHRDLEPSSGGSPSHNRIGLVK